MQTIRPTWRSLANFYTEMEQVSALFRRQKPALRTSSLSIKYPVEESSHFLTRSATDPKSFEGYRTSWGLNSVAALAHLTSTTAQSDITIAVSLRNFITTLYAQKIHHALPPLTYRATSFKFSNRATVRKIRSKRTLNRDFGM